MKKFGIDFKQNFYTIVIYSMVWIMVVVYMPSEGNVEQGILKRRSQYK